MRLVNSLREYAQVIRQRKEDNKRNLEELNTYVTMTIGDTKDLCKIGDLRVVETMDKSTNKRKLMLIKRVNYNKPFDMMNPYVPTNMSIFFDVLNKTIINIEELLTLRFYDFREIFPYSYLEGRGFTLSIEEILNALDEKLEKIRSI